MTRTRRASGQQAGSSGALPLPDEKKARKAFYAGAQMRSPMGGVLELVRVKPGGTDVGLATFECLTSSLRYELTIPRATRTEKQKVKAAMEAGEDPACPRCESRKLVRSGPHLSCPRCGVAYARVP